MMTEAGPQGKNYAWCRADLAGVRQQLQGMLARMSAAEANLRQVHKHHTDAMALMKARVGEVVKEQAIVEASACFLHPLWHTCLCLSK